MFERFKAYSKRRRLSVSLRRILNIYLISELIVEFFFIYFLFLTSLSYIFSHLIQSYSSSIFIVSWRDRCPDRFFCPFTLQIFSVTNFFSARVKRIVAISRN